MNDKTNPFVSVRPLDEVDAQFVAKMRVMTAPAKGLARGIEGRPQFDSAMASVLAPANVKSAPGVVGGVPGTWVTPASAAPGSVLLHLHGGWFNFGSAAAFANLVGQIANRINAVAFIPDYRLAPEHPFPAATDDVWACFRGLAQMGYSRIALTGDSAGGNLALGLASRVVRAGSPEDTELVGVAVFSPVTDLTLSGESYQTRADADPLFTRGQVADLVQAYLGRGNAKDALASPLLGPVAGLPPVRIHVGDSEVLLDDSRRYVAKTVAADIDANLDIWMGMPHGFVGRVGALKAADQAMDAVGAFLTGRLTIVSAPSDVERGSERHERPKDD